MAERGVDAYIVPLDDEGRREWLSGFTGSNGDCVVTNDLVGEGGCRRKQYVEIGRNLFTFSIILAMSWSISLYCSYIV